jgi:peptidyl-prolyl cis-trans isomerase SurA
MRRLELGIRAFGAGMILCAAALFAPPPSADAAVVEKIVAVVGDDAILLSELRSRAAPLIRVLASKAPTGPQRTAAESQVYRDVLNRMVEEQLEVQAAERQKVTVTPDEVDKAVENVAAQQHLTVDQLLTFAEQRSGLSEIDYRAEIRRQVLEGKLLSQRVRGRIRLTEEDLKNAFNRTLREERDRREYRPQIILLAIPPNASPQVVADKQKLAQSIYDQLKAGAKFEDMATQFSEEPKTNQKGGDMGIYAPIKTQAAQLGKRPALSEEVEARVLPLEPGEFTQPFRLADSFIIMGLKTRQPSKYTTFEAAKDEMVQRVQNEILAREKESWIEELRKRTHIEIRL